MFLRMAGSTFDPAPWMTNLKACSMVSLQWAEQEGGVREGQKIQSTTSSDTANDL